MTFLQYLRQNYPNLDNNDAGTVSLLIKAAQEYADSQNGEMKKAGLKATDLLGHLKDQHGFNTEEDEVFDEVLDVFGYEGPW